MGAEVALREWRRAAARAVLAEHAAEQQLIRRLAREWHEHPSMAPAQSRVGPLPGEAQAVRGGAGGGLLRGRQDGASGRAALPTKSFTGMRAEPAGFSCAVGWSCGGGACGGGACGGGACGVICGKGAQGGAPPTPPTTPTPMPPTPPGVAASSQAAAGGTYGMLVGEAADPQFSPQHGTPGSPIATGGGSPNAGGGSDIRHVVGTAAASRPPHAPIGQPSAMRPGGGPPLGRAAAACDEVSRPHALPAAAEFFATDTWMGLSTPGGQWRSLSVAIAAAAISCAVRVWNQTNPHL